MVTAFSYIFLLALLSVRRVERGTLRDRETERETERDGEGETQTERE